MNLDQRPLSVLMPCYNAGPYVEEAIQSVLNQGFTDFEFIIINDGSTDDTLARILKYQDDDRIRLINQENKGLIDSLNQGIQWCSSRRIARMDADDVCLPHRFEKQMAFMDEHPEYLLVGSQASVMDKEGRFLMNLIPLGSEDEEIRRTALERCPFIHPCVMFDKEAVLSVGGYPKNALTFEDHLLWVKMIAMGKVHNLPEILVKVRFNPESVTVDEKWRGREFMDIRRRSVRQGYVSQTDAVRMKTLIDRQNFHHFKQASYYAMIGKKYLWDSPDGPKARESLIQAIRIYPRRLSSYVLFLFSLLPGRLRKSLYKRFKKK